MTNKEAIEILDKITAIKALEELCDDCISRSEALSVFRPKGITEDVWKECDIYKKLTALPSVTPQPKMGRWIYTPKRRLDDETDEGRVYITDYRCTCSECGGDFGFRKMSDAYCKYCGAKMEVSE